MEEGVVKWEGDFEAFVMRLFPSTSFIELCQQG